MTSKLIQDGPEKTFALVFDTGEEVVAGLVQFARDYKLSGAHLTAIGAFERVTLGFFDAAKKDYKRIAIEEQVELMSLVGKGRTCCNNLNGRSNTVKADVSWVVNSASHVGRYQLTKSVIVSG